MMHRATATCGLPFAGIEAGGVFLFNPLCGTLSNPSLGGYTPGRGKQDGYALSIAPSIGGIC